MQNMHNEKSAVSSLFCRLEKSCPHSWDKNKRAGSQWMRKFEEKHVNVISETFLHDCKNTLSRAQTSFTLHNER